MENGTGQPPLPCIGHISKKKQKTKHEYFLAVKHYLVSDLLVFYNPGKLNYV